MTKRIPTGFAKLVAVALMATGCLAITAGAASAATPQVAYNNLNTVPVTVNGFPNTDTSSEDYEYFPVGNQIETRHDQSVGVSQELGYPAGQSSRVNTASTTRKLS